MSVARHYEMRAREGKAEVLEAALIALAAKVEPIEGCEGITLMHDAKNPGQFVFIEQWESIDAHKAGGQRLGREVLDDVMAAVAEPPKGRYLDLIPV